MRVLYRKPPRGPENVTETLPVYLVCGSKTDHHLAIENWLGMDRRSGASRRVFFSRQRLRRVFGHRFTGRSQGRHGRCLRQDTGVRILAARPRVGEREGSPQGAPIWAL